MNGLPKIQPELLQLSADQIQMLKPYLIMLTGIVVITLAAVSRWFSQKATLFALSILTLVGVILASMNLMGSENILLFNRTMAGDSFSNFFN